MSQIYLGLAELAPLATDGDLHLSKKSAGILGKYKNLTNKNSTIV